MKTDDEILARISEIKDDDFFGFQSGDLISVLPWGCAKEFFKKEFVDKVESGQEKYEPSKRDAESVKAAILAYMPFAWDKAENERGISSLRSIDHMRAWLFLLGDESSHLLAFTETEDNYSPYGKPILRKICEHFGWDTAQWSVA